MPIQEEMRKEFMQEFERKHTSHEKPYVLTSGTYRISLIADGRERYLLRAFYNGRIRLQTDGEIGQGFEGGDQDWKIDVQKDNTFRLSIVMNGEEFFAYPNLYDGALDTTTDIAEATRFSMAHDTHDASKVHIRIEEPVKESPYNVWLSLVEGMNYSMLRLLTLPKRSATPFGVEKIE